MPEYTYQCEDCTRSFRVRMSYAEYGRVPVRCPYCGSERVRRRYGRVAVLRGGDVDLDALAEDPAALDALEKDPRTLARVMRRMGEELGEDLGPEFDEVVSRLEKGQTPEEIEQALPELADEASAEADTEPGAAGTDAEPASTSDDAGA